MSLPSGRDETLHHGSTIENSLLNRLQDRIVALHEEENFQEQSLCLHLVDTWDSDQGWDYDGSNHYYASSGAEQYHISPLNRALPGLAVVKRAFVLQYRPAGSTVEFSMRSRDHAVGAGVQSTERIHCAFSDAQTFDAWELVEAVPVADTSTDPDSAMVIDLNRAYFVAAKSTVTGERVAAVKLIIERAV